MPKHSAEHLAQLDLLCAACLPQWLLGVGFADQLRQSSDNLEKLVTQSTSVLVVEGKKSSFSKSFRDWFSILYKLAQSPYWSENFKRREHPKPESDFKVERFSFKQVDSFDESITVEPPHPVSNEKPQVNIICMEPATAASSHFHLGNQSCDNFNIDLNNTPENFVNESINVLSSRRTNKLMKPQCCSRADRSDGSGGTQTETAQKKYELKSNCHMKSKKSLPPPTFKPLCSGCGGDHLGIDCWKRRQRCHWCGKMGHSEDVCWRKAGACLICGSKSHRLRQCSHYIPLHAPVFPPWCLTCGTTHLGSNCEDPYME